MSYLIFTPLPKIFTTSLNQPIVPTIVSMALSRLPTPSRALTIRSTATAITSATSLPLIFGFLYCPVHVRFTKDVVGFCGYVLKGAGPLGSRTKEPLRVGRLSGNLHRIGYWSHTQSESAPGCQTISASNRRS